MFEQWLKYVWIADGILAIAIVILTVLIFATALAQEIHRRLHHKRLIAVKKNLDAFARSTPAGWEKARQLILQLVNRHEYIEITEKHELTHRQELLKQTLLGAKHLRDIEKAARSSRSKWKKIESIIFLGYVETPDSLSILSETLNHKDEDVSYFSLLAIGQIKTAQAAQILLDFLGREKRPFSGYKIATLLEDFPKDLVVPVLEKGLEHRDASVRYWAWQLLCKFNPPEEELPASNNLVHTFNATTEEGHP